MMRRIFSLLQILTINSLNVKHQGINSNQLQMSHVNLKAIPQHISISNAKMKLNKVMNPIKNQTK